MAFKIASSPHVTRNLHTSTVMQRVILCLLPGLVVQCAFFGWGTLIQVLLAIIVALSCEAAVMKLRNRSIKASLSDNSAMLTAILIGVAIPPLAPWWMIVMGTVFAIVIVKHLYGGLGHNLFNPAMAAYVLLLVSFPVQMTSWIAPSTVALNTPSVIDSLQLIFNVGAHGGMDQFRLGIDGISMATPLDTLKTDLSLGLTTTESMTKSIFDGGTGIGWFWVNLAYLAGGLVLLKLKAIRWHIGKPAVPFILGRDHARRLLYRDRSRHRGDQSTWPFNFRRINWCLGIYHPYPRWLSRCLCLCRATRKPVRAIY